MEKILSIIIPSYNMEAYLPKCLGSLVIDDKELLQKLDVIVVNDGSKDHTSEIAHEFEAKYPGVFRVVDKTNGHYGSCINRGLSEATGKYVRILDADDWFDKNVFGRFMSFISAYEERGESVDLILSDYILVNETGQEVRRGLARYPQDRVFGFGEVIAPEQVPVMHGTTYRTAMLREIGYLQTEGILYTDTEWVYMPMLNVNKVAYCPGLLYYYLVGREGQSMNETNWVRFADNRLTVFKKLVSIYLKEKDSVSSDKLIFMEKCLRKTFNCVFDVYYCKKPLRQLNNELFPLCNSIASVVDPVFPDYSILGSKPLLSIKTARLWFKAKRFRFLYPVIFRVYAVCATKAHNLISRSRRMFAHDRRMVGKLFNYDKKVFLTYAGSLEATSKCSRISEIVMGYHVLEKGLTMPRRRLGFGHDAVLHLIGMVNAFERDFGMGEKMVNHAIGVVKQYLAIHEETGYDFNVDSEFWVKVKEFAASHVDIPVCPQLHITADEFFAHTNAPFPEFAASRHTCRHYAGVLPLETVKKAVELAMTAPSACNRQHVRVHCVSSHEKRDVIYTLQNGNRGFGRDADKLLVITSDLNCLRWNEERNDIYTNAGMFMMNLCYALHYYKVAHCILNWSVGPESDKKMHSLLGIPDNERIAALIACGPMPTEVDIAASPRKDFSDVFFNHE